jgi:HEAT repeat protein
MQAHAISALVKCGDRLSRGALRRALLEADSDLRKLAAGALAELGERKWPRWIKGTEEDFARLASASDADARQISLLALDAASDDVRVRTVAAFAASEDPNAVDALVDHVDDSHPDIREASVAALGRSNSDGAVWALAHALQDEQPAVRLAAVKGLGDAGDGPAVELLLLALRDSDRNVRREAVKALAKAGSATATAHLLRALNDPSAQVATAAVKALGDLGGKRATRAVARALRTGKAPVRAWAARVLGGMEAEVAAGALAKAVADKSLLVREQAARALKRIAVENRLVNELDLARRCVSENKKLRTGFDRRTAQLKRKRVRAAPLGPCQGCEAVAEACLDLRSDRGVRPAARPTGLRSAPPPGPSGGLCVRCRLAACAEHADGNRCPVCGQALAAPPE